jgi:hypothetical protein
MKGKMRKFDRQTVLVFEFLDTPGDEIAPRSDEIGENFEHKRLSHRCLLSILLEYFNSMFVSEVKSKGLLIQLGCIQSRR